eukprot:Gregarina_sp_Poly_1__5985@NODE_3150_length_1335_cov_12_690852_g2002_i0_p1_GENE_NODE_3150_length_1335_cov_12_690852_g2002_i0NODE_3150_length_1335_cov_12_690852_g2002_i0_p1_ORF_typecomplete_len337_score32_37Pol_alpha_B_N/PF08418_10/0_31DUF2070/PF09843_9/6_NODE_3150_length_1335_cov_12_690852_g2002_i01621172
MGQEHQPLTSGIIFVITTGAELALSLTALCTGNYATFIPALFPTILALAAILYPSVVIFALCAAFHFLATLFLILALVAIHLTATPWKLGESGREVTCLIGMANILMVIVSLYLNRQWQRSPISWRRLLPSLVLGRLSQPGKAQKSTIRTQNVKPASEMSPGSLAIEEDDSVILALPESLLNTPRTEGRKNHHHGSPMRKSMASPTRQSVSATSSAPFAALMAQPISNRNSAMTSPCLKAMNKGGIQLPVLDKSPPGIKCSPYSSPQPSQVREAPWLGGPSQLTSTGDNSITSTRESLNALCKDSLTSPIVLSPSRRGQTNTRMVTETTVALDANE